MDRQKELDKEKKEELVSLLGELSKKLEKEIPVTGNKDEIIERILAAEKELQEQSGSDNPGDSDDQEGLAGSGSESGDQSSDDSEDDGDDLPEEGELRIKALVTFETLVEKEKMLVCKEKTVNLPEEVAQAAIEEGLAKEI